MTSKYTTKLSQPNQHGTGTKPDKNNVFCLGFLVVEIKPTKIVCFVLGFL
jgi:hypothetical protein